MLGVTDFLVYLFVKFHTVFFVNLDWRSARPLFTPGPGRYISLIVIAMFATSTMSLFIKIFTKSRWVDIIGNVVSLGLIGLLLTQPFDNLFAVHIAENLLPTIRYGAKYLLLFTAVFIAVDLVRHIVILSRRKLRKSGTQY
jgi:hypothetical protein